MPTVLIADDQPLIRAAVRALIGGDGGVTVVGEAATGGEAVRLAGELRPDVVVMDIRMPGTDGIAATRIICADPTLADVRVLILTTFEDDENVAAALAAGASGFVGKGADPATLVEAVRTVHRGEALLSPVATRLLIERYLQHPAAPPGDLALFRDLTERETEVLVEVARGRSNAEIAEKLYISPHTAKTHVSRIMSKLQAHDRAQLVVLAYEHGLVTPGDSRP